MKVSHLICIVIAVLAMSAPAALAAAKPVIAYVPIDSEPPVPAGLKVACMAGPNILSLSKTCPVVKYQGLTTWAYSFIDNRVSLALVTYDAKGNVVGNITKDGARYVWQIIPNDSDQALVLLGQSNQTVTVGWAELTPASQTSAPQVVSMPAASHPPVPAGLKVTCMASGTDLSPSPTCPVVRYQGITTWAFSFIDNRVSLAFVSYDARNNVVRNRTVDGTRYVWQITVDPAQKTVTATGQSNQAVTASWADIGP